MIQISDLFEFQQIRMILNAEATGLLATVEISIEYQDENLKNVELWVRVHGDNVKGHIRNFEAKNKDPKTESFHQDLITQVNKMPDINDYIDAWIWRRQKESDNKQGG